MLCHALAVFVRVPFHKSLLAYHCFYMVREFHLLYEEFLHRICLLYEECLHRYCKVGEWRHRSKVYLMFLEPLILSNHPEVNSKRVRNTYAKGSRMRYSILQYACLFDAIIAPAHSISSFFFTCISMMEVIEL